MWICVSIGAAIVGVGLGLAGFIVGAGVPDERAGEAASLLAKIGLGVGALLGAAIGAGYFFLAMNR